MSRNRQRGLGRGLQALIPISTGSGDGVPQMVSVDQIRPSPTQVRRHFSAEHMRELAESIRTHGLLQPVLVRPLSRGFELVAGERRWRAARMAGLERIPALVRDDPQEQDRLLLGLIENLQREDLNPIEEAQGIRQLIDRFGLTHEAAAARLGKHRVAVSQAIRLLNGCPALLSATSAGAISAGHARALVGLPTAAAQEHGLRVVIARQLSVRQTERWVQSYQPPRPRRRIDPGQGLHELSAELSERISAPVSITGSATRGRVSVEYRSREELDRICATLRG